MSASVPDTAPSAAPAEQPAIAIRVRPLTVEDTDAVVDLLSVGFTDRTPDYWRHAMAVLRDRSLPGPYPRFGYGLSAAGKLVGVLLLIFSRTNDGSIRANVSSWYVEADYRFYSNMLLAPALRLSNVTFVNVSPAPHTIPTIAKQGFVPYVGGIFVAAAALGVIRPGVRVSRIAARTDDDASISETHAALGCISFEVTFEGKRHSFVFLPRNSHRSGVRFAQLVYCEDVALFVRFAGSLGRRLLMLGYLFVIVDANGPVAGLIGRYFEGRKVKCYRGKTPPRLGDLSNTELVLFGP